MSPEQSLFKDAAPRVHPWPEACLVNPSLSEHPRKEGAYRVADPRHTPPLGFFFPEEIGTVSYYPLDSRQRMLE